MLVRTITLRTVAATLLAMICANAMAGAAGKEPGEALVDEFVTDVTTLSAQFGVTTSI